MDEQEVGKLWVVGHYLGGTGEAVSWRLVGIYSSREKARDQAMKPFLFVTGPIPLNFGVPPSPVEFPRGLGWSPVKFD